EMRLIAVPLDASVADISRRTLEAIIARLFQNGYALQSADPRLTQLLDVLPARARLLPATK
ncbi:MAG: hypothetical protein AAGG72_04605, partial [Pseudomonadota bacterium]